MADKKLNEVTKVTDMAYVPVIMSDGSIGQIAKADLASVVAGLLDSRFVKLGASVRDSQSVTSFTPIGQCGIILLNANVNYASESNQHTSLWLYMNTVSGTNVGYNTKGVSVQKIASLKHDYGSAISDCSLVGSSSNDEITISKGGFNTFSYIMIPLS